MLDPNRVCSSVVDSRAAQMAGHITGKSESHFDNILSVARSPSNLRNLDDCRIAVDQVFLPGPPARGPQACTCRAPAKKLKTNDASMLVQLNLRRLYSMAYASLLVIPANIHEPRSLCPLVRREDDT